MGSVVFGQSFGGGLDAGARQELITADVEGDAEFAIQLALEDAGGAGESGIGDDFVAVLAGVLHGDGDAHDADDLSVPRGKYRARELRSGAKSESPLL